MKCGKRLSVVDTVIGKALITTITPRRPRNGETEINHGVSLSLLAVMCMSLRCDGIDFLRKGSLPH